MGALLALLTSQFTQIQTLIPFIIGFAVFVSGAVMSLGNHQRGKEGLLAALVGGAVMLTSQQIGAGFH